MTVRNKWMMTIVASAVAFPALVSAVVPTFALPTLTLSVAGKGEIVIEMYNDKAPKTTAHIIGLAKSGFYDGQKIFRVMKDPRPFLVLFGDPNTKSKPMTDSSIGQGGSGKSIAREETGKSHVKGAVGLATRQGDPNSGDSQFFIMLDKKPFLDGSYTVFGSVTRGMDIVEKLEVGDQVTSVTVKGD